MLQAFGEGAKCGTRGRVRFPESDFQIAFALLGSGGFWSRSVGEEDAEDFVVHGEAVLQLVKRGGLALENDIHVETGVVLFVSDAGEVAFIHFLDGFDFAAGIGDFGGDFVDGILEAFFFACSIQYEQAFVSFHFSFLSSTGPTMVPLNWFIAFCMPSLSQHSAWSEATAKTLSANLTGPSSVPQTKEKK